MSTSAEQINQLIGGYTDLKAYFEANRATLEADRAAHAQRVDDLVTDNEDILNGTYNKMQHAMSGRIGNMFQSESWYAANNPTANFGVGYALWHVPRYADEDGGYRYHNIGFVGDVVVFRNGFNAFNKFEMRVRARYDGEELLVRQGGSGAWTDLSDGSSAYGISFDEMDIDGRATRILKTQMSGGGAILMTGGFCQWGGTPYAPHTDNIRHDHMGYIVGKAGANGAYYLDTNNPNQASPFIRAAFNMEQV